MPDIIDDLQREAEDAIGRMKEAALAARAVHARAELLRHMRTTAAKVAGRDRAEAVAFVVREWMAAWAMDDVAAPGIRREMERFTHAICAAGEASGGVADAELRASLEALEAACERTGASLADQMAWRSECAHGWWEMVRPVPADLPGRKPRPSVPAHRPGTPFWEARNAPHCGG